MDELIVLDSGSTDNTVAIAEKFGTNVIAEEFKSFTMQKNRAMELCTGDWLFNLDADEEVTPELRKSIEKIITSAPSPDQPVVYNVCRKTQYMGRWMKHCGWYPEFRTRLSRKGHAVWKGESIHEKLEGDSSAGLITGDLLHRPYANLGEHLKTINYYSGLWAQREATRGRTTSIIGITFRPVAKSLKMYILQAGYLDCVPGLIASMMGAWYTFIKYARLYELSGNSG